MNDSTQAQPQNTPLEKAEDLAQQWREDLFKPELTTDQIVQANDKFQQDVTNLKTAMLVLTRTPVELLELGRKDLESFESMLQMVSNAAEYTKLSVEMADAALMRMMITAGKLVEGMDA